MSGVDTTIDQLEADRFKFTVVTNQPDVAAGVQKLSVVDKIHESLHASLGIDNISACYHVGADNYECRTPKPGVLVPAAEKHNIGQAVVFWLGIDGATFTRAMRSGAIRISSISTTKNSCPQRRIKLLRRWRKPAWIQRGYCGKHKSRSLELHNIPANEFFAKIGTYIPN